LAGELRRKIEAEHPRHLPQSKLGEAIRYALGQWREFTVYLEEGRLEIDNNLIYAARGINEIMPPPGLCRVAA
jgi:hypothetical protein